MTEVAALRPLQHHHHDQRPRRHHQRGRRRLCKGKRLRHVVYQRYHDGERIVMDPLRDSSLDHQTFPRENALLLVQSLVEPPPLGRWCEPVADLDTSWTKRTDKQRCKTREKNRETKKAQATCNNVQSTHNDKRIVALRNTAISTLSQQSASRSFVT